MSWSADPIPQLEHDIYRTRAEQRCLELQKDDTIAVEYGLLHELDRIRSLQGRLDRQIDEKREAINSLQDEVAAQIPKQAQA